MTTSQLIGMHLQQFLTGPNLTGSHVSQYLDDVSIEEATTKLYGLNSIAQLVFHINYYIHAVGDVLEGKPLVSKDSLSFDAPLITTKAAWQLQKEQLYAATHRCAQLAENLPQEKLKEEFALKKYGSYEHNLVGLLEHSHYHFGQMVIIKKIVRAQTR